MSKQRSHAARKTPAHAPQTKRAAHPPVKKVAELANAHPFMAWPSFLFDRMINPWKSVTPLMSWMDNSRGGNASLPKTESRETGSQYLYRIALPGVSLEHIALSFQNGVLMLKIETLLKHKEKGVRVEHAHSVCRAFTLPERSDSSAITAKLKNGILTITVPKSDDYIPLESRNIAIT